MTDSCKTTKASGKPESICHKVTAVLFFVILITVMFTYPLAGDKTFSENENRVLAARPEFSPADFMSGDYSKNLEKYMADQIVLRDGLMQKASDFKRLCGLKDINGVYLGKDDYLFNKLTESDIDTEQFNKNLDSLNHFFANMANLNLNKDLISVMPVPSSDYVLSGLLPRGAAEFDTDSAMHVLNSSLSPYRIVDLRNTFALNSKNTQLYYRTDHHWTAAGAAAAYMYYKNSLAQLNPAQQSDSATSGGSAGLNGTAEPIDSAGLKESLPKLKTVSSGFYGSLYSKVLCSGTVADDIQTPAAPLPDGLLVSIAGNSENTCYDSSALSKKDKYNYYFGGNYSSVEISTGIKNGRRLLIIKDSFANSFAPFLFDDYEKICMIDLRYYIGNLEEYTQEQDINEILVLYELSNIMSDTNISKLGTGK